MDTKTNTDWIDYFDMIRPDLSEGSRRAYVHQAIKVANYNNLPDATPLNLMNRLANKTKKDKTLDFITIKDSSKQSQNQRLASIASILKANEEDMDKKKYNTLHSTIKSVARTIRDEITMDNGENKKNEKEEEAFKTTWSELETFAESYHSLNSTADRDYIILNLLLNNYIIKDDTTSHIPEGGIKYNVLLRTVEYSSLYIWTNKKKPPLDHKNYIWIPNNKLYIQHSKTTGGIKAVGTQATYKEYPIREGIMDKIKIYMKTNRMKNKDPLFLGDKKQGIISTNYFGKIVKTLLSPLGEHFTIGMIRKMYENRPLPPNLNANQMREMSKMVDHTIEVAQVFYKKI